MDQATATNLLTFIQIEIDRRTGRTSRVDPNDVEKQVRDLLNDPRLDESEKAALLNSVKESRQETDSIRLHADKLIARLPSSVAKEIKGIPVGGLPFPVLNAATMIDYELDGMLLASNEPIIVVLDGLRGVFYGVSGACAATAPILGMPEEVSIEDATESIFRWMLFLRTGSRGWMPEPYRNHAVRHEVHLGLFANALNFVLGHEYAHVLLGHLRDPDLTRRRLSIDIDGSPGVGNFKHAQEFAADAKSVDLSFAFAQSAHPEGLGITAAGIELALQVLRLQEELFSSGGATSSHPPAAARLDAVHERITARYGLRILDYAGLAYLFERTSRTGRLILKSHPLE
jgi:hypothetical protein